MTEVQDPPNPTFGRGTRFLLWQARRWAGRGWISPAQVLVKLAVVRNSQGGTAYLDALHETLVDIPARTVLAKLNYEHLFSNSGLFDESWYAGKYLGDKDERAAVRHFVKSGDQADTRPTPLFDPDWYREHPRRPHLSRPQSFAHFLLYGIRNRKSAPNPWFASPWYRRRFMDDRSTSYALLHYQTSAPTSRVRPHALFSSSWYLRTYGSLLEGQTPLYDFLGQDGTAPRRFANAALAFLRIETPADLADLARRAETRRDELHQAGQAAVPAHGAGEAPESITSDIAISLIIVAPGTAMVDRVIFEVMQDLRPAEAEIIIVHNSVRQGPPLDLLLWELLCPNIRFTAVPDGVDPATAVNSGARLARGRILVFLNSGAVPASGWLEPLTTALTDNDIGVVQPVVHCGSTFHSAGIRLDPQSSWLPVLRQSETDRRAVEDREWIAIDAPSVDCVAIRRTDFTALGGFEPASGELWHLDFALRLKHEHSKRCVVCTASSVAIIAERRAAPADPGARRYFLETWPDRAALAETVAEDRTPRVPDNVFLARQGLAFPRFAATIDASKTQLRFAIKIAAPTLFESARWGDRHFASSIASALNEQGHPCRIDAMDRWYDTQDEPDDVVIALLGRRRYECSGRSLNLAWLISHPGTAEPADLGSYDHVFVASTGFAERMAELLGPEHVSVLLQCTNTALFFPARPSQKPKYQCLFVGVRRPEGRPVVDAALAAGLHVTAFGPGWESYHANLTVGGAYVDNREVGDLYRSAGVVLNDHWDDMRADGFISNRLFDACACAVPVISDYVPGMETIFGEAVSTVESGDLAELSRQIDISRNAAVGMREEIAAAIAENHSFARRATEILATVRRLTAARR